MVSLTDILASNTQIASTLPPGLVAIFVGGTSGIGEATIKKFAQYTIRPRAYIIGRSQAAAERIIAECRTLNPEGLFEFIQADVSLIKVVDEVCEEIKRREKVVNLLFLSCGVASLDGEETSEHIPLLSGLTFYTRTRFITSLLPLIRTAPSLRRIITVAGGSLEGPIYADDYAARHVPLLKIRGHLIAVITLSLEAIAKSAPEVSFVHDYPGTVYTPLISEKKGIFGVLLRAYVWLFGRWVCVPVEESGERHLFLATSARFAAREGRADGVGVEREGSVAKGSNGSVGSGVYAVGSTCEGGSEASLKLLEGYRERGLVDDVLRHAESEFKRITGAGNTGK